MRATFTVEASGHGPFSTPTTSHEAGHPQGSVQLAGAQILGARPAVSPDGKSLFTRMAGISLSQSEKESGCGHANYPGNLPPGAYYLIVARGSMRRTAQFPCLSPVSQNSINRSRTFQSTPLLKPIAEGQSTTENHLLLGVQV